MQIQTIQPGIDFRLAHVVRFFSLLLLSAVAPTSYAAVYTCVATDGTTTYSDQPCNNKPEVVETTPAPPRSAPVTATPALAPGQARVRETQERIAVQCETSDYNDWYRAQNPKPGREEKIAKLKDILQKCRAALKLHDTPAPSTTAAPTNAMLPPAAPTKIVSSPTGASACVRLDQIDNSHTPVDLYASLADCMHSNRDADAVALFVLAGMDSAFDALRVTDNTAGQARQILIMGVFEKMPADEHNRFETAMKSLAYHPQGHAILCEQVKKIGPPQYFPAYMINHGMGAVMGALSNQAPPAPLKSDFNAAVTWTELQTKYLNCTGT